MKGSIGRKDKNGKLIHIGDTVMVKAQRLSGSYSSWYRKTNKNHGDVLLKMYVIWNEDELQVQLLPDQVELKKIVQPMGREQVTQVVQYPTDFKPYWGGLYIEVIKRK